MFLSPWTEEISKNIGFELEHSRWLILWKASGKATDNFSWLYNPETTEASMLSFA